jgi:hypothetical protein
MESEDRLPHALPGTVRLGELGSMKNMRPTRLAVPVLGMALWMAAAGGGRAADAIAVEPLAATARRANLRVLEGRHLVLATDRPQRAGDGVDELTRIFDEAVVCWCHHYGMEPAAVGDWRSFGCLVVDRERFRAAGLLPKTIPDFVNGFCDRNRFWMADQSNPDYRRHLLLHEGAHAFTLTLRDLATPEWYTEGIAEFLATHRLERDAAGVERFVHAPLPARRGDVEQLGRIEELRRTRAGGRAARLATVLEAPPGREHDIAAYATKWAAVVLFARHPEFGPRFAAAERGPLDADFNARLAALPGWDMNRAAREYDAFIDDVDYGYDFARLAVDWSPGNPLVAPVQGAVDAARGWQNTGVRLDPGGRCRLSARGRVRLGAASDPATRTVTPVESAPDGISLRWYRGRPVGAVLVAQWVDAGAGPPGFRVLGAGGDAEIRAATSGPLFVRVNDAPGDRADNAGGYALTITPP